MGHFLPANCSFMTRRRLPGLLQTSESTLPRDVASSASARTFVRNELRRWGTERHLDDCLLIVSELVTNAVCHGGSALTLRLSTNGTWIYGEVFDEGEGMPHTTNGDLDATHGRGLLIVDSLADDWGVSIAPGGGGKIVWFLIGGNIPAQQSEAAEPTHSAPVGVPAELLDDPDWPESAGPGVVMAANAGVVSLSV